MLLHLNSVFCVCAIVFRDINRTVKAQAAEGAKAEERLLNMDFVTAKAKELSNRRERAEVRRPLVSVPVKELLSCSCLCLLPCSVSENGFSGTAVPSKTTKPAQNDISNNKLGKIWNVVGILQWERIISNVDV